MAAFDRPHTSSYFLFVFHCNYGRILYHFQKKEILVEKRQVFMHLCI